MFWFGLILSTAAALIGIAPIRNRIRSRWSRVDDSHFDTTRIILVLVGVLISGVIYIQNVNRTFILKETLIALRDYSSVARLNPLGLTGTVKPPLKENSSLSEALEGTWIEHDEKISLSCEDSSLEKFRRVILSFPRFPFTYHGLSLCLRSRGDSSWRSYAEKAVKILEITTSLESHHPIHDKTLTELREILDGSK